MPRGAGPIADTALPSALSLIPPDPPRKRVAGRALRRARPAPETRVRHRRRAHVGAWHRSERSDVRHYRPVALQAAVDDAGTRSGASRLPREDVRREGALRLVLPIHAFQGPAA